MTKDTARAAADSATVKRDILANESAFYRSLGLRLKKLRTESGLTQTDIGTALGITFQQVQKYERGADRMTVAKLVSASKSIGVPLTSFIDGLDLTPPPPDRPTAKSQGVAADFDRIRRPRVKRALKALMEYLAEDTGGQDAHDDKPDPSPTIASATPPHAGLT